ncbi:hypothetical protein FBR02_06340 [Anaerolineae bacterium CFX9]|nr:hypothetical protein [Anaerolineae bacterium CFX9]
MTSDRSLLHTKTVLRDNRIFRETRIIAILIVPVLIAAFIMLYLFPHDSDKLFAWPIRPEMSAMMLGGTYLGGAWFFVRAAKARQWHTIQHGILPVASFAGILGIATLLHWDRFTQGHISFILWAFLYLTLPFVLAILWLLNRRTDPIEPEPGDYSLSKPVRLLFAVNGGVLTIASLLLLITPETMIPTWPWTLTPLTARVMAAMFILPGIVSLNIAREHRWSCFPMILQAQMLALVLIIGAILRASDDFDWSQPGAWTFTGGIILTALVIAVVHFHAERQTRTARQTDAE